MGLAQHIEIASSGSVLLRLPVEDHVMARAASLDIDGCMLRRKRELHVTLLDADATSRVTAAIGRQRLLELARAQTWRITRGGDGAIIIDRKRRRCSLVEWIELPAFARLREALGEASGAHLPATLPHITQYASDARGIGLPDMAGIERLRAGSLRVPGVSNRTPGDDPAQVRAEYRDGCSLLAPGVVARLGEASEAVNHWLEEQQAMSALLFSAADPFGTDASPRGNAVRWQLLDARLEADGIRAVAVAGKEDEGEPARLSACLLDPGDSAGDELLRDYEQLAAVQVQRGRAPTLLLHPALRAREAATTGDTS